MTAIAFACPSCGTRFSLAASAIDADALALARCDRCASPIAVPLHRRPFAPIIVRPDDREAMSRFVGALDDDGLPTGEGYWRRADGAFYEGHFRAGAAMGGGRLIETDGAIFQGAWRDGLPYGRGLARERDGRAIEGWWLHDRSTDGAAIVCLSVKPLDAPIDAQVGVAGEAPIHEAAVAEAAPSREQARTDPVEKGSLGSSKAARKGSPLLRWGAIAAGVWLLIGTSVMTIGMIASLFEQDAEPTANLEDLLHSAFGQREGTARGPLLFAAAETHPWVVAAREREKTRPPIEAVARVVSALEQDMNADRGESALRRIAEVRRLLGDEAPPALDLAEASLRLRAGEGRRALMLYDRTADRSATGDPAREAAVNARSEAIEAWRSGSEAALKAWRLTQPSLTTTSIQPNFAHFTRRLESTLHVRISPQSCSASIRLEPNEIIDHAEGARPPSSATPGFARETRVDMTKVFAHVTDQCHLMLCESTDLPCRAPAQWRVFLFRGVVEIESKPVRITPRLSPRAYDWTKANEEACRSNARAMQDLARLLNEYRAACLAS